MYAVLKYYVRSGECDITISVPRGSLDSKIWGMTAVLALSQLHHLMRSSKVIRYKYNWSSSVTFIKLL